MAFCFKILLRVLTFLELEKSFAAMYDEPLKIHTTFFDN